MFSFFLSVSEGARVFFFFFVFRKAEVREQRVTLRIDEDVGLEEIREVSGLHRGLGALNLLTPFRSAWITSLEWRYSRPRVIPSNWALAVSTDRRTTKQMTHESHSVHFLVSVFPQVVRHTSLGHPLGNHTEAEQVWRDALDIQNVAMSQSPADNSLLAVVLGVVRNSDWDCVANPKYLFRDPDVINLIDEDVFHGEGLVGHISGLPHVGKAAGGERAFVHSGQSRGDEKGSWEEPVYPASFPQRSEAELVNLRPGR